MKTGDISIKISALWIYGSRAFITVSSSSGLCEKELWC